MSISSDKMVAQTTGPGIRWILPLASIAVIVAALSFAKALLITLTLAVLLSFLLSPVCDWLERRRLGRVPSVLGTALLGFLILGLGAWAATLQMSQMEPKIPEYKRNIEQRFEQMNVNVVSVLARLTRPGQEAGDDQPQPDPADDESGSDKQADSVEVVSALAGSPESFAGMFGTLLEVLGTIAIIIVLVIFILIRREDLRDRFIHLMGEDNVTLTTRMLEDANTRVRSYLSMLFLINGTFGIAVAIGLHFIGVPGPLVWGIAAASLRFIPYIGEWIAAVLPIGLSFAISTGWAVPLMTIGLFAILEFFSSNVMEPLLYGRNTGVSTVGVFVAAIFWMWLWGPVGLILATPLTVCVLVIGKHIPDLRFLDTLLGSDPVFEPKMGIYQRLLAGDREEATSLVNATLKQRSLVDVYDSAIVPAIVINETHWQRDELPEEKYRFVMRCLRETIQDCGDRSSTRLATDTSSESNGQHQDTQHVAAELAPPLDILCLPAKTESDELTALMLAQVLETPRTSVRAVPVKSYECDLADWIATYKAEVIIVCATPPASVMHARNLCKQIREQLPEVRLIVGLWDTPDALDANSERFGHDAVVVLTLAEAEGRIRQLVAEPSASPDALAKSERERIARLPANGQPRPLVGV